MLLTPLWSSALETLAALVSLDSKLFSQLREVVRLCVGPPSVLCLGNSRSTVSWGKHRAHFICFRLLRDHGSSMPGVQRFENHCFIYFVRVLVHLNGKVSLVLVTPSRPVMKVLVFRFYSL